MSDSVNETVGHEFSDRNTATDLDDYPDFSEQDDESYRDRLFGMILNLKKYCRTNYLPIFNHPETEKKIMQVLTT